MAVDSEFHEYGSGFQPPPTTNNRMELKGAIEGLTAIHEKYGACEIELVSDSKYVVLGCQQPTRKRNVNNDLWDELDAAIGLHDHVQFRHIKGHLGIGWNEVADGLAVNARKSGTWKA